MKGTYPLDETDFALASLAAWSTLLMAMPILERAAKAARQEADSNCFGGSGRDEKKSEMVMRWCGGVVL
jgi:hypothetical protein